MIEMIGVLYLVSMSHMIYPGRGHVFPAGREKVVAIRKLHRAHLRPRRLSKTSPRRPRNSLGKTLDLSIPSPGHTNLASRVPPDIFAVPKPHISLNDRLHGYVELATYPSIHFSTFLLRLSILGYGSLERSLPLGCPERLWWCFLYGCMSLPGFMKHAPLHIRILILCLV